MPPYKEKKIEKLFYSTGETAKILNVNITVIRYWEKEFDIIKPRKNNKGNRLFSKKDLENLKMIHHLLKNKGFTIKGAKKTLQSKKNDLQKNVFLKEKLLELKKFLISIRDSLWILKSMPQGHFFLCFTYKKLIFL